MQLRARLAVFYLVAEVTGFSQTVNGEKTLPHSTSQAWRNTHPDESLNLKTQSVLHVYKCLAVRGGQIKHLLTWLLQMKLAPFQ